MACCSKTTLPWALTANVCGRLELYCGTYQPVLDEINERLTAEPGWADEVLDALYFVIRSSRVGNRAYSKPSGYAGAPGPHCQVPGCLVVWLRLCTHIELQPG